MLGFHNDAGADWVENFAEHVHDLARQAFLDLGAAAEALDEASYLAEANPTASREITEVGHAGEGQQVVLAHGIEGDVTDDDHLLVFFRKNGREDGAGIG